MNRTTKFKVIATGLGIVLAVLFSELGFRLLEYLRFHNLDEIAKQALPPIEKSNEELTLGQVIQLSPNRRVVYQLVPSSSYQFQGVEVMTNTNGFRDKDYPVKKDSNTYRIIGIGDSVMFGWAVEAEESYMSLLELSLNEKSDKKYEVINTAVPGYNTAMEVELLEKAIDLNQVDMVVINYVSNDFDLPNFIRRKPNFFGIKKSRLLQYFGEARDKSKWFTDAPFDDKKQKFQSDPAKVPTLYKDLVGEQAMTRALAKLDSMSNVHKFEVLYLSHSPTYQVPDLIKKMVQENGWKFVDVKPYWQLHLQEYPNSNWQVSPKDYHPSVAAHSLIAVALHDAIIQENFVN